MELPQLLLDFEPILEQIKGEYGYKSRLARDILKDPIFLANLIMEFNSNTVTRERCNMENKEFPCPKFVSVESIPIKLASYSFDFDQIHIYYKGRMIPIIQLLRYENLEDFEDLIIIPSTRFKNEDIHHLYPYLSDDQKPNVIPILKFSNSKFLCITLESLGNMIQPLLKLITEDFLKKYIRTALSKGGEITKIEYELDTTLRFHTEIGIVDMKTKSIDLYMYSELYNSQYLETGSFHIATIDIPIPCTEAVVETISSILYFRNIRPLGNQSKSLAEMSTAVRILDYLGIKN